MSTADACSWCLTGVSQLDLEGKKAAESQCSLSRVRACEFCSRFYQVKISKLVEKLIHSNRGDFHIAALEKLP